MKRWWNIMGNAGIGTPYWYEWEIGIIECLHMMTDASIESVTLQSSKFQSLDDVVINYADGSIANIQVKHTDVNDSLTYSDLESDKMLKSWASEWSKVKANYKIKSLSIVTNRKWGPRTANGKCSFSHFPRKIPYSSPSSAFTCRWCDWLISTRRHRKYAGTRKISAATHASGLPSAAPK